MRLPRIAAALAAGVVTLLAAGSDESLPAPVANSPRVGADLCRTGEFQFRRGNFEAARDAFESAARLEPETARAWWGLGRIAEIQFRREEARDLFARAFRLDPRDTDIVLSYLDGVTDAKARATLLRNVAMLSWNTDRERALRAWAQLALEERLGGKPAARLASAYAGYRVPLAGFRPAGSQVDGLLVTVRINGGRPLRLVLDTGARAIAIHARAAKDLGLEPLAATRVEGFGEGEAGDSRLAFARTLEIGDLQFEDCPIEVAPHSVVHGADGILGIGLLEAFRMRIDPRARVMELSPAGAGPASAAQTIGLRNLLLVSTGVSGKSGWFLIDTGAAFTGVARELAPRVLEKGAADLAGVSGALTGAYRIGPISLNVGDRGLTDLSPVALDLGALSAREGVEISGVLGYPALSKSPFTLDLRHGVVTFE